jgi:aminopeptidase
MTMPDPRVDELARTLIGYSLGLQAGERILIEGETGSERLVRALLGEANRLGARPLFQVTDPTLQRRWLLGATRDQMDQQVAIDLARLRSVDARLLILAGSNDSEGADVPLETSRDWSLARQPYADALKRLKWCTLRYPTASAAQAAGMSTEAYEDFCFDVECLNYARMGVAMDPLVRLMGRTDRVRILGPGTDLTFSIRGIPTVKSPGHHNIPDGEVSTAPVRDSADGVITYNVPSPEGGVTFRDVRLRFERGRIIEAGGSPRDQLLARLDTDEGARYLGEFSFGVNPGITRPVGDILFDEKMTGSLHVTPGTAYEVIDNGNRSALHWDLVLLQIPEWGGGEVWFDGVLVRKDGRFLSPELAPLNPENLGRRQAPKAP